MSWRKKYQVAGSGIAGKTACKTGKQNGISSSIDFVHDLRSDLGVESCPRYVR
jgi:hypothetical protein